MRTYKEYYKWALDEHLKWYSQQKEEWWKKDNGVFEYKDEDFEYKNDYLAIKGDYLETTMLKSNSEKNDSSIISNHTNVYNKEWCILFDIIGQALIDWCVENNETDIYSYCLIISRTLEDGKDTLDYNHKIKYMDYNKDWPTWKTCDDESILEKFNDCSALLTDIIYEFISSQGKNIPLDWNHFSFGLDSLNTSCKYKCWTPDSDGDMHIGNDSGNEFDEFMLSM